MSTPSNFGNCGFFERNGMSGRKKYEDTHKIVICFKAGLGHMTESQKIKWSKFRIESAALVIRGLLIREFRIVRFVRYKECHYLLGDTKDYLLGIPRYTEFANKKTAYNEGRLYSPEFRPFEISSFGISTTLCFDFRFYDLHRFQNLNNNSFFIEFIFEHP
ncbi:hypothetical protein M513_04019 [Trichuris suis]|uniref:Uncharacterized protein n=1 Tax=Trichuris suis TaxID=68888 RepID=A0A085MD05_9BILA|nr:hypothetical protein M513_04019 [Trichuris suis]